MTAAQLEETHGFRVHLATLGDGRRVWMLRFKSGEERRASDVEIVLACLATGQPVPELPVSTRPHREPRTASGTKYRTFPGNRAKA